MSKEISIPIDNLRIGHYVVGMDKSWLETPFMTHRFFIHRKDEIDALRASGVKFLTVDLSRSRFLPPEKKEQQPGQKENGKPKQSSDESTISDWNSSDHLEEVTIPEFEAASLLADTHVRLVHQYKKLFQSLKNGKDTPSASDVTFYKNALNEVSRLGRSYPDALLFMAHLQSTDDETYIHSVNTMFLAIYLAITKNIPQEEVGIWGMCGLFHDMGKCSIPAMILHKKEPLTLGEWDIIKSHPSVGEEILKTWNGLPPIVAKVAGEHHVRKNGKGYPDQRLFITTDTITRAVMILDTFDALTADRSYRSGMPPPKALKLIAQMAQDSLDTQLVAQVIKAMGIYPIGSVLELGSGEVGVVIRHHIDQNNKNQQNFSLLMMKDENGVHLRKPVARKITWSPGAPPPVARTHNHSAWGIDWTQLREHLHLWTDARELPDPISDPG